MAKKYTIKKGSMPGEFKVKDTTGKVKVNVDRSLLHDDKLIVSDGNHKTMAEIKLPFDLPGGHSFHLGIVLACIVAFTIISIQSVPEKLSEMFQPGTGSFLFVTLSSVVFISALVVRHLLKKNRYSSFLGALAGMSLVGLLVYIIYGIIASIVAGIGAGDSLIESFFMSFFLMYYYLPAYVIPMALISLVGAALTLSNGDDTGNPDGIKCDEPVKNDHSTGSSGASPIIKPEPSKNRVVVSSIKEVAHKVHINIDDVNNDGKTVLVNDAYSDTIIDTNSPIINDAYSDTIVSGKSPVINGAYADTVVDERDSGSELIPETDRTMSAFFSEPGDL